jgi:CxxC motif-containing protein (DUF1111 family)
MSIRIFGCFVGMTICAAITPTGVMAVSPHSIAIGEQLFRHQWQSQNPALGSDGLGPLFNANSCVSCHRQGGAGGGGQAMFNAKSIGIESIEIYGGNVTSVTLANLVSRFHPGFVQSEGSIVNVLPLPHHGGSDQLRQFHDAMTERSEAEFSDEGGPTEAGEVRIAGAQPIVFEQQVDGYRVRIVARMFGRNTTALFGSGLIDAVSDELIERQAKLQRSHAEISGRPSTLPDGRFGKFGWRANIASLMEFTDQACANEMGLQTKRKTQSSDVTNPTYQNTTIDITDEQVQSLHHFTAALPAPHQHLPTRPDELASVRRGEALFASVGCAVCHVRDMGPAQGVFSDLLLHDMGSQSVDLNHAEPYIARRKVVSNEVDWSVPTGVSVLPGAVHYGPATLLPLPNAFDQSVDLSPMSFAPLTNRGPGTSQRPSYAFHAPTQSTTLVAFRLLEKGRNIDEKTLQEALALRRTQNLRANISFQTRTDVYERMEIQPTLFNQEWRTAPLWGLRDSAPYLHDGRAETILEAIVMHAGESEGTRDRFLALPYEDRQAMLAFLDTLAAPGTRSTR